MNAHTMSARSLWVVAGLGLTASLVAPITIATATPDPGNGPTRHAPALLGPAPDGARSSVSMPGSVRRDKLASLAVDPTDWRVGSTFTFNPFDDVQLEATVASTRGTGHDRSWDGTLAGGGTFEAASYRDALRLSVHAGADEFELALDTDEPVGRVVQYRVETDPEAVDTAPAGKAPAAPLEAPELASITSPAEAPTPLNPPTLTDAEAPLTSTARRSTTTEKPLLWSSRRGNVSLAQWTSTTFQAPTGGSAAWIDEWVQFTPQALAAGYGGDLNQATADVRLEIDELNRTFANSHITSRVRLKKVSRSPMAQRPTILAEYLALANTKDGYLDNVLIDRRAARVDHLTQVTNRAPSDADCGRGTLGGTDYLALTTIGWDCFDGTTLAYAHEFGHNLNAQHDRTASSVPSTSGGYNFGYIDPSRRFRTVMSYPTACPAPCVWAPMFSSSTVPYQLNSTTWLPAGDATTDNRRAVLGHAPVLANVAPDQMYVGEIGVGGYLRAGLSGLTVGGSVWLPWSTKLSAAWYVNGRLVSRAVRYRPTLSQVGKKLKVVVTGVAPGYPSKTLSSPSWTIKPAYLTVGGTGASGRGKVGNTLRIRKAHTRPSGAKMSVVWRSGSRKVATGSRYRVQRRDAGKSLTAVVTYRKKGHQSFTTRVRWSSIVR